MKRSLASVSASILALGLIMMLIGLLSGCRGTSVPATKAVEPVVGRDRRVEGLGLELVWIDPGSFRMGTPSGGHNDERPVREVRISRGFWLGKFEVTQHEYQAIMGENPSNWKGDDLPVERVNWHKAVEFCEKLTERERRAGRLPDGYVYRLPTEAEWEYAARGGNRSRGFTYAGSNNLDEVAWHWDNSNSRTHPVGRKQPNELGLYDMTGNVWEWVHDWYQNNYSGLAATDPSGPRTGSFRVYRGGSWNITASICRVAYRNRITPSNKFSLLGFRVSLAPPVQ